MKNILILLILSAFSLSLSAQREASGYKSDTLTYAGSADTVIVYLGGTSAATAQLFRDNGILEIGLRTDSLSGNPVASAYVEYSYDEGGSHWHRHTTLSTINGAAPQFQTHSDADCAALRARVVCIAAATTQSERVRVAWRWKRNNN
jgi:hypothetical protein